MRHRRRIQLQDRTDMQRLCGRFEIKKTRVESAEALHAPMVCPGPCVGAGFAVTGNRVRKPTGPGVRRPGDRWQTDRVRRTRGPYRATRIDPTITRDIDV